MKRLPPRDVIGKRIKVGDVVRIIGIPDLSGMSPECRAESLPVFQHLLGTYRVVREFDEFGYAWLSFKILKGPHSGLHAVGIEPHFLKIRATPI